MNENVKNTTRIFPDQGREPYVRLDMNENPIGLPVEVVDKLRDCITPEFISRYPEPDIVAEKYAKLVGVNPDQLCLTNGSDNAIRYVMQTFAEPGKDVLTVRPTFEMYMVNCWLLGLNHKTVEYDDDFTISIDKLVAAIDDNTTMVILVNPNNPLGNTYSEEDVRTIVEAARAHDAMVVIDEAYHYFTKNTHIKLIDEYDNIIVLRTFSKCLSMAGLRLGVAISNSQVAHYLNSLRLTFEVNTAALKMAEIILDTPGLIDELARIQIEGRTYVEDELKKAGYEVIEGESNFVSFKPNRDATEVSDALKDAGILVKTFGGGLLKGWIRINTGSVEVMKDFITTLAKVDR
ncbi:MAG: histidinol-phosphate transaminase [Eggerthellaceae bacterium]|nr:histidinol-phosphate transaminase [Eggerthellaceae bacterium]